RLSPPSDSGRQQTITCYGRQPFAILLSLSQIVDPIPINTNRGVAPAIFNSGYQPVRREITDKIVTPIGDRAGTKRVGEQGRRGIEIIPRHLGVNISLAAQKATDVAAVFPQQRIHFVFRMSLKEEEQRNLVPLFDKCIDARRRGGR